MQIAVTKLREWRERPDQFVEELFGVVPDEWQRDVLQAFPRTKRQCMLASKGPGKTAVEAWLAWNFLLTRPFPKLAATSLTKENLADNLWAEMAKWQQKCPLLKEKFTWNKMRIEYNDSPETWFMSARVWSRSSTPSEQGNALAGLHADYIMFVLDESGGIPESVMVAADAALSSCVEGHILQGGNPSMLEGPLYRACTVERPMWHITTINGDPENPKRSPRISKEWAQGLIDTYGRDHPYVKVNVLGEFPPASFNALIGIEEVQMSMRRSYAEQDYNNHPKVLGVDVAREGLDASIIFPRQGLQAFIPLVYRNIDGNEGANRVARKWKEWDADACFVDNTGGFGSSWVDNLNRLGFAPIPVHFSEKSSNPRYYNKRTEIIFECVEWIKKGGALPNVPELVAELTQSTYTFKNDKLIIEPKELLKEKIGHSPDHLDSLALTWAAPTTKKPQYINGWPIDGGEQSQGNHTWIYHPFARDRVRKIGTEKRK